MMNNRLKAFLEKFGILHESQYGHRAELYDTFGIFTGAMALKLEGRDDKAETGKGRPAFYSVTA